MKRIVQATRGVASRSRARLHNVRRAVLVRTLVSAFAFLPALLPSAAEAGLYETSVVPLRQFGFSTAGQIQTATEFKQFYDVTAKVLGAGAVVRTGLGWDPTRQNLPSFDTWSSKVLAPALARGIVVLPGIRTLNLDNGGYRMPTDTQWVNGLRMIVRMYGPNGIYQKGGSYVINGNTVKVAPHSGFKGLTDFELWNEPNTQGNLNGAMTPSRITHLLKIGSAAMREEAAKLGFKINIVGPAIGGIDLEYLKKLWYADNRVFTYINTLSIHAYTRHRPSECDPYGSQRIRCIESFELIRKFMDSKGGTNVHIGTTEGGVAGDRGTCTGPQVKSEDEQRDYSTENLVWIRNRPWLKFDFWITPNPIDGTRKYSYACDSGKYDIPYWEDKLGVVRPDLSLKPWGMKYRDLKNAWSN